MDYTPKSGRAEWHLTYKCNLSCGNCNRLSQFKPTTDDMTIDDAKSFIKQCHDIGWIPNEISLIGGEPTLHKDFDEFVELALGFVNGDKGDVVSVWSNMYGKIPNEAFKRWNEVKDDSCHGMELFWGSEPKRKHLKWHGATVKDKSVNFLKGMTISPKDMGLDICPPDREGNDFGHDFKGCYQHSAYGCGISVDSVGYSICAMGGAIDGMLELGVRTKDLSKLFDKEFALKQTCDLCDNCGFQYERRTNQINWELQDNIKVVNHTHMSPTWYNALIKRKETK